MEPAEPATWADNYEEYDDYEGYEEKCSICAVPGKRLTFYTLLVRALIVLLWPHSSLVC